MRLRLHTLRRAAVACVVPAVLLATAGPAAALDKPFVGQTTPFNGQTRVDPGTALQAQVVLQNGSSPIVGSTLAPGSNLLVQPVDPSTGGLLPPIAVSANVDGAGAAITITPTVCLQFSTKYKVTLNPQGVPGIMDAAGAKLKKKVWAFHVTPSGGSCATPTTEQFSRQTLVSRSDDSFGYTSVVVGPGSAGTPATSKMLYAGTLAGRIDRWPINADGTLGTQAASISLPGRDIVGLAFEPGPVKRLWISSNDHWTYVSDADDWSGEIVVLSGTNLTTAHTVISGLPRSSKDHETNSLAFDWSRTLYFTQGSMTATGAADVAWGNRPEHMLSAALLRITEARWTPFLTSATLDVRTGVAEGLGAGTGTYNPLVAGAPLELYATGLRNAFDIVMYHTGWILLPTNGSAPGGNVPAIPSLGSLPASCQDRVDGSVYGNDPDEPTGRAGISNLSNQRDFLFRVDPGSSGQFAPFGYYGHPNPSRCEWTLGSGNPDPKIPATKDARVKQYPTDTPADPNYVGYSFTFGYNFSPDGAIEYLRPSSGLHQDLMVTRYSGGDDILVLPINQSTGKIDPAAVRSLNIPGTTDKFNNPLDIAQDPDNGNLYVTELNPPFTAIELLKPPA